MKQQDNTSKKAKLTKNPELWIEAKKLKTQLQTCVRKRKRNKFII